jgi:hypothetical protein
MNDAMRAYLARTAQGDKERNQAILEQCRKNLVKYKVFEAKDDNR